MTITIQQAIAQLDELGARVEPHVARGFSRGLERAREAAVVETVKRGFGRRLWGNKRAGAFAMFKREPIRLADGRVLTTVIVKGLPALAEVGGHTLPHVIKPRRGRRLSFVGSEGRRIAVLRVKHPGSRIARAAVMERALDRLGSQIAADIAKALEAFIDSVQKRAA